MHSVLPCACRDYRTDLSRKLQVRSVSSRRDPKNLHIWALRLCDLSLFCCCVVAYAGGALTLLSDFRQNAQSQKEPFSFETLSKCPTNKACTVGSRRSTSGAGASQALGITAGAMHIATATPCP